MKTKKKRSKEISIMIIVCIIIVVITATILLNKKQNKHQNQTTPNANENQKQSYVQEMEDGVKLNKNTKLNTAKEVDGYIITNIQLTTKDGMTTLLADVTNKTGAKTKLRTVYITLLDEKQAELVKVTGIIDALDVEETTQLNISMTSDYVNAYDFKAELK